MVRVVQAFGACILLLAGFQAGFLFGGSTRSLRLTRSTASEDSFGLAKTESEGFFDDISNREWRMMKEKAQSLYPNTNGDPRQGRMDPGNWFQNHYEPDFVCRHERRIGRLGDGGKWICDPHRIAQQPHCLVYSVGSNGDASFEAAVLRDISKNCEIHVFDFGNYSATVQEQAPGVHYHQWGLAKTTQSKGQGQFKSLADTVKELGHEHRVIDIFKIDCEGCEYSTFPDWFSTNVTLRQVAVEVHAMGGGNRMPNPQAMDFFERFYKEGYVIAHKEANVIWSGKAFEYVFLKLSPQFMGEAYNPSNDSVVKQ